VDSLQQRPERGPAMEVGVGGVALAEQGEAGSGLERRPLPCQYGQGAIAPVWVSQTGLLNLDVF
jgi:hypothetical protein